MVMVSAVLTILAVPVYSHLLAWMGPKRLVPLGFAVSAAAHVAEWYWFGAGVVVPVAVYIHVAAFGALLLSGFWSLISELFDPHAARRQFVRIASAGSLGGVFGGIAMERVGAWASADASLLVLAALHALCAAGLWPLLGSLRDRTRTARVEPILSLRSFRASPQASTSRCS